MLNEGFLDDELRYSSNDELDKSDVIELQQPNKISLIFRRISAVLEPFSLWNSSLKEIENNCGCAVLSYFKFISWLFKINLCMFILQLSILVIPFFVLKPNVFKNLVTDVQSQPYEINKFSISLNCTEKNVKNETAITVKLLMDMLQGLGPLEDSPMFLGFYFDISYFNISSDKFTKAIFNTPVAYSITFWLCMITSFIITVYSSGKNYKLFIIDDKSNDKFGLRLLTGFDYGITKAKRIRNMKNDLSRKLKLQYKQIKQNIERSLLSNNQIFCIYLTRIIVNILFIGFLLLIYYLIVLAQGIPTEATKYALIKSNEVFLFLIGYVPSVTVAMINVVFQFVNNKVVRLEKYSASVAVGVCLKRVILVQAISLLIFVVTLLDQINQSNITDTICQQTNVIRCWENYVGQQFYRFSIIGFMTLVIIGPLIQLFRSLMYIRFRERHKLVNLMGTSRFDLSIEGFLLISSQCVCWLGLWFCPFLIVIMLVELFLLFYIRKSMFMRNYLETTMETTSVVGGQRFLLEMLLYSLAFVMLPIGYILSNKTPSRGCSPFRIYEISDRKYSFTTFLVDYITSLSNPMKIFWTHLTSAYTILSILALFIIFTYVKYAQTNAYSKYITALRKEIIIEENNQMFYKRQLINAAEVAKKSEMLSFPH